MRKLFLVFFGFLALIAPVAAQSPLTNFSLYGGNNYFTAPGKGDGTSRFGEARVLFGRQNDYRLLTVGFFANYIEVGSKLSNFLYHDTEWAGGAAMNFGSQYWLPRNEVWGWLNAGLKFSSDRGEKGRYRTEQTDQLIHVFGGVMLKNSDGRGPFFIKKLMATYQQSMVNERKATWEKRPTGDTAVNKGYLKVRAENTFVSLPLAKSGKLRFEPKVFGSASYEFAKWRTYYSAGIGLTLAREYSQEIMTLEGEAKFNQDNIGMIYSVGVLVNIAELGKAILNK